MHGGPVERVVVVPTVPHEDVALLLGLLQDGFVVHAGKDDRAVPQVGLVLLALLDRDVGPVQVIERLEPLDPRGHQVPVGHRVAHDHRLLPTPPEVLHHLAGGLALSRPRPHGTHRHDRHARVEHGRLGPEQRERGAGGHRQARLVHDVQVGYVRICEHDLVDLQLADEPQQLVFEVDGDPIRVARTGQLGRIPPVLDERDLGGREGHHLGFRVVPIDDVEVVEVAPSGAHDQDTPGHHRPFQYRRRGLESE